MTKAKSPRGEGWVSSAHCVAEIDPELLILLPPPSECWDYRMLMGVGDVTWALCTLPAGLHVLLGVALAGQELTV